MFTLPHVQVGGHTYKIELINAGMVDDSNENTGDSHHYKQVVRVATLCSNGENKGLSSCEETLLHELIHCASRVYNSDLTEDQVVSLSEGMYQILKQFGLKLITDD
jgi:hypothetical protein